MRAVGRYDQVFLQHTPHVSASLPDLLVPRLSPTVILPYSVLKGVSSPRRAALLQPLLRDDPLRTATQCEARVHTRVWCGHRGCARHVSVYSALFFSYAQGLRAGLILPLSAVASTMLRLERLCTLECQHTVCAAWWSFPRTPESRPSPGSGSRRPPG